MSVLKHRPGVASASAIVVLSLAFTLVQLAAPSWSERAGLDLWNYPALLADEQATKQRRNELEAAQTRLHEQVDAAEHIADLVIDSHLSLANATDRTALINEDRPIFLSGLRGAYPDSTSDRKLVARYVILKVQDRLKNDPARSADVLGRLNEEFHNMPE